DRIPSLRNRLVEQDLKQLEDWLHPLEARLQLPDKFVLYGGTEVSALLDVARAVVRRAERRVVALHRQEPLQNAVIVPYVNRLSDALFILARFEEFTHKVPIQHPRNA
ncbi:hypothetical protein JXO59_00970, partial [candidate division KSB1 bacterium]|nr:hypothetical protein [candidate division KSB1 bacterium]